MGRTWDAIIDLFAARTIPIRTIERVSGIIVTEQLSVDEEGLLWANCGTTKGWGGTVHYGPNYGTYNVLVRGDSAHSSVKATVRWVYSNFKHPLQNDVTECSTKHVFERTVEADTKARAEVPRLASGTDAAPRPEVQTAPPRAEISDTPTNGTSSYAEAETLKASNPVETGVRTNDRLLAEPDFTKAIRGLQALQFLAGFREIGADSLLVEVSDQALVTDLSEYNLGPLLSAYSRVLGGSRTPIVILAHGKQTLGTFTRSGLVLRDGRQ